MTLLERAGALEMRAKRQRTMDERENVARELRQRTTHLEKLIGRLEAAQQRLTALRDAGKAVSPWPTVPSKPLAAYKSLDGNRRTDAYGKDNWSKLAIAFEKFAEKVEELVRADIGRVRKESMDGLSSHEIATFESDPATQAAARALASSLRELETAKWDTAPAMALKALISKAAALRSDATSLHESGATPELRLFLSAARRPEGVSLSSINQELAEQLEARGLLSRMRVRFQ